MATTLILTRNPLNEFKYGAHSGRFGELVAVKGPKIESVRLVPNGSGGAGSIPISNGSLEITGSGEPITEVKRYTSMERFKVTKGKGFYVQLHPKPTPYTITYETGNTAVQHLRNGKHSGKCFRVHGGNQGAEQGILIHEAPNVTWLIGCISPRPLNDFHLSYADADGNPSFRCMNELFHFVGHARSNFFVLDW